MLTSKGFKLKKESISEEELKKIQSELTVKPFVIKDYDFNNNPFPVYRSSTSSIYIPKFYAINKYGVPSLSSERTGVDININFKGDLRPNQLEIMNNVKEKIEKNDSCVLSVGCGQGKCLAFDTEILMYDGSIKKVQDVVVGDKLMGDDSNPRNVISLARGKEEMFEIVPEKGESYTVNRSHILSLRSNFGKSRGSFIDISVNDCIDILKKYRNRNVFSGYRVPINFSEKKISLDPFILGVWLCSNNIEDKYLDVLRSLDLGKNLKKHIPIVYKCNSRSVRMKLLEGIMSTDKYSNNVLVCYSETLSHDIKYLCRSLGFCCYITRKNHLYVLEIEGINSVSSEHLFYNFKIVPKLIDNYYGFEIDGNRRFVLGNFDVTHNTVMALWMISKLGKKTLILVHKEFLLNQWIERIEQFLPDARIGIIRQKKIDVENKDIVIGMIQSITSRKYPKETFDSFANVVIDECHRICSRSFSQALFSVATKYSLGLSATPHRMDGLSKLLNWFLGDIIVPDSGVKELKPTIKYVKANYKEEPSVSYNMRGKVNMPSLITDISIDPVRNKQIVELVKECLKENRKILIMTERRCQCQILSSMIDKSNLECLVGIYIGGMSAEDLEITNTKDVIISTYAMTAEGYDNKKIDTLIMATPRSSPSLEQIIGRCLRQKNINTPLVIDIYDNIESLGRQFKGRERFYKKQKYNIDGKTEVSEKNTLENYAFIDD